jgi:hypothetical protein
MSGRIGFNVSRNYYLHEQDLPFEKYPDACETARGPLQQTDDTMQSLEQAAV